MLKSPRVGSQTPLSVPLSLVSGFKDSRPNLTEQAAVPADASSGQPTSTSNGSSWWSCIFLVVNAALGAGVLQYPYAYTLAGGIEVSIFFQTLLMVFVILGLLFLVVASDHNNARCDTYETTIENICGPVWARVCSCCIIVYTFGTCIAYLVIIGDQWDQVFDLAYGPDFCLWWYLNRKFTVSLSAFILILPFGFPERIDFLKYTSFIGAIAVSYVIVLIVVSYGLHQSVLEPYHSDFDFSKSLLVMPTITFGYQCHLSLIPIYACMEKRSPREFAKTIAAAMTICMVAYTMAGVFGHLLFGELVQPDVLISFPDPTGDVLVAIGLIALKTYTVYPILQFVGRSALEEFWHNSKCCERFTARISHCSAKRRRVGVRCFIACSWFLLTVIITCFVPDTSYVINMLGCLATFFILIFPGVCMFYYAFELRQGQTGTSRCFYAMIALSGVFLVFGAFICGLVTVQSIEHNIQRARGGTGPERNCSTLG